MSITKKKPKIEYSPLYPGKPEKWIVSCPDCGSVESVVMDKDYLPDHSTCDCKHPDFVNEWEMHRDVVYPLTAQGYERALRFGKSNCQDAAMIACVRSRRIYVTRNQGMIRNFETLLCHQEGKKWIKDNELRILD